MTRTDQKILFTALAFVAVLMKGENASSEQEGMKVCQLADCIEAFCLENIGDTVLPPAPVAGEEKIDRIIEQHIRELKGREETHLPEDKTILIQLYDRLQQRKARRMQREFYASATEARLADLILHLLDEEIEDEGALT